MRQLPPIILREKYYAAIQAEIQHIFDELIYKPLANVLAELPGHEMINSMSALLAAIRRGEVWYDGGKFEGKFSSTISAELTKLGAKYNASSRTWSLNRELLPIDVQFAQASSDARLDELRQGLIGVLDNIDVDQMKSDSIAQYDRSLDAMESDFKKTVTAVKAVTIVPEPSPSVRNVIAEEWGQNLDLYIKEWAKDNILALREQVQQHALEGGRAESLVEGLKHNYAVSKDKAKFLARQETSLLMSKFRETRYKDIGCNKYRWSGSMDQRERPDHKILQGKIFTWDSPPSTNRETGARNHPGEDFGCRCVAIALVD